MGDELEQKSKHWQSEFIVSDDPKNTITVRFYSDAEKLSDGTEIFTIIKNGKVKYLGKK